MDKIFNCWFSIDDEKFAGDYDLTAYENGKVEIYKFNEENDHKIKLGEKFRQQIAEIDRENIEIVDFESEHFITETEKLDCGSAFYDYERGHADYRDEWVDAEVDTITGEIKLADDDGECWEALDHAETSQKIKEYFKLGK